MPGKNHLLLIIGINLHSGKRAIVRYSPSFNPITDMRKISEISGKVNRNEKARLAGLASCGRIGRLFEIRIFQKLTIGIFLRPLPIHIRVACGSRGRLLLRGHPLDLKTFSLSGASPEIEQNLGPGGHRYSDPSYLHRRAGRGGCARHASGPGLSRKAI